MNLLRKTFAKMKSSPHLDALWYLLVHWKSIVVVLVPLIFLPVLFLGGKPAQCGYIICIMAAYWTTEALPLPVTGLIPMVLFPLFGILSSEEVCMLYFKETNVMFLGGVIIAIAVEHCNLHKRIALRVLLMVGTSPQRLMFGFMLTTMFLSMWISNSASTALMVPIVTAILNELKNSGEDAGEKPADTQDTDEDTRKNSVSKVEGGGEPKRPSSDTICYFLAVAYAANIGGTGTITGTATNLVFKGILESIFKEAEGINFATWMEFNVPLMLFNTALAWVWLQILYMNMCRRKKTMKMTKEQKKLVRELIHKNYKDLGPMTYHETNVLILFLVVILLWFFRKPEFIPGWASLFPEKNVKDATAAMLVVILLFVLPANLDFLKFGRKTQKESPPLLTWRALEEKLPFGILVLLGSGYSVSKACEVSGLSDLMGTSLEPIKELPLFVILTVILFTTTFATEICSNTAIANIVLPVLAKVSRVIRIHPLYLMLPTTVCCSFAFMLPVATPPNAIVVAASNMRTGDMMKAGFGMNIICVISLLLCFTYIGVPMYNLDTFPKWAELNATLAR